MTALDYFLYDNRTWSPRGGRDWGLKAATGVLDHRADLKSWFDRYCGAMPGDQGQLGGFGEAIGGVRVGSGYLLCVALESSDAFGRPSWAVFGLWCPRLETLEQVLSEGDPIGSARALLGAETPPAAIEIRPAKGTTVPRRRRHPSAEPEFHRFEPGSTVRDVISLLLGAAQARAVVPNVLGVTASSRLPAVAGAGFNLVYCHPLDDRTERALERLRAPGPAVGEAWFPPAEPAPPASKRLQAGPPAQSEPRSRHRFSWLLWLSLGIVVAGVLLLMAWDVRRDISFDDSSLEDEEKVSTAEGLEDTSSPETFSPEERSAGAVLKEIGERLEEIKELSPEALRKSSGFVVAETLEVLPEYQDRRNRVLQAYSALMEIRGRMVGRQPGNWVAYYYDDEDGRSTKPTQKLQKITEILREAPLGGEDCQVLREAFGFEFDGGESVARRWCESLRRLEKTAVRLSKLPGIPD